VGVLGRRRENDQIGGGGERMCLAWEGKGGKERAGLGYEEQRRQQSNEATKGPGRARQK